MSNQMGTVGRKLDHIRICLDKGVECPTRPLDDIILQHKALPEMDLSQVDMRIEFLGRTLQAPLMICAMTGGHPETERINVNLSIAAQELGLALGVGSQRAALEDPGVESSFSRVRDAAPDVPVIGNIGAVELRSQGPEILDRVAEMIDADAVAVHLNFLQECIQPEGEPKAQGVLHALEIAARESPIPLMVKETGAGLGREDATSLIKAGIDLMDVAGVGGTSWSAVEAYRAEAWGDDETRDLGELFRCWGITTPVSVVECVSAGARVIASGGVRNGIDVARCISLGAYMAGTALPLLQPATLGSEAVVRTLRSIIRGLKVSMFLTGSQNIDQLRRARVMITGQSREILEQKGIITDIFAKREL